MALPREWTAARDTPAGERVEIRACTETPGQVELRRADPAGGPQPVIHFPEAAWSAFAAGLSGGEFDFTTGGNRRKRPGRKGGGTAAT